MMPFSLTLAAILMVPFAAAIALAGMVIGLIMTTVLKTDRGTVHWDGLLALAAFLAVLIPLLALKCSGCADVSDGWTIRGRLQHPELWALVAACLCPVLHQAARRRWRSRTWPDAPKPLP